jgi:transposase
MAWRRGQTYAQDLRDRVLALDHLSARAVAERFTVSISYVIKVRQRRARTGAITPRPQKPPVARKLVAFHAALRERVRQVPDATLAEHREWLAEANGVVVGLTTIWKTLAQLGLTLKKSHSGRASRRGPTWPKRADCGASDSPNWT